MHTIREILPKAQAYLAARKIPSERLEAELLLAHVLRCRRVDLFIRYDQPLEEKEVDEYRRLLRDRASHVPTAYLTGKKEFFCREFHVKPGVLIPRPETELLVETAADLIKQSGSERPLRVVDVGTGSGIIAITLAKMFPDIIVYATDISGDALDIARENIKMHDAEKNVISLQGDLFLPLSSLKEKEFDLLISNPPYIPDREIRGLAPEISHEPAIALEGGEDGLSFYRRIFEEGKPYIKKEGWLAMEIGYNQAPEIEAIAVEKGWRPGDIRYDLANLPRVMVFTV